MHIEFNKYQIYFYANPYQHRFVQLFMDEEQVGSLTFDDYKEVPENTCTDTQINLKYHESDYRDIVDLIRNESPVYIFISPDNNVGGISTSEEKTGEGE